MYDRYDHRRIARDQRLLHFQPEAPGIAFWHPAGAALCRRLEEAARDELARSGYREVRTPQVMRDPVWEASGHLGSFSEGMFKLESDDVSELSLRPVNCPGHVQIYRQSVRSHRDLPLRLAEFGVVHRKEPSGALQGLFRLRQFTQDDGHVFCRESRLDAELLGFCRALPDFYRRFGFGPDDLCVGLSTRPRDRLGEERRWDEAERALERAARDAGLSPELQPGEGAFYGPKLEFKLRDRLGRVWQCGTIQLDFVMPERFDLGYVDEAGVRRRPVMLHRALFGSVERFVGVLLEQHRGRLPAWLAEEQVRVLCIGPGASDWSREVLGQLQRRGVRARFDLSEERLGARIERARRDAVPYVLVLGPKEAASRQVRVREGSRERGLPLEGAAAEIAEACAG